MEEEIIQKIYKLTNELASQQQSNQDLATNLTFQLTDLKVNIVNKKIYIIYLPSHSQKQQRNIMKMVKEKETKKKERVLTTFW
jgi:hypothetical protein